MEKIINIESAYPERDGRVLGDYIVCVYANKLWPSWMGYVEIKILRDDYENWLEKEGRLEDYKVLSKVKGSDPVNNYWSDYSGDGRAFNDDIYDFMYELLGIKYAEASLN